MRACILTIAVRGDCGITLLPFPSPGQHWDEHFRGGVSEVACIFPELEMKDTVAQSVRTPGGMVSDRVVESGRH